MPVSNPRPPPGKGKWALLPAPHCPESGRNQGHQPSNIGGTTTANAQRVFAFDPEKVEEVLRAVRPALEIIKPHGRLDFTQSACRDLSRPALPRFNKASTSPRSCAKRSRSWRMGCNRALSTANKCCLTVPSPSPPLW